MKSHDNNFDLLRLLFASLVIISHVPEQLYGDRSRELATMLWRTMSLGEMAVDGFFVISGYLVTQSYFNSSSTWSYLYKRVLRVFPAFIGVSLLLLLVLSPLVGADRWTFAALLASIIDLFTLAPVQREGVFSGLNFPVLNGPMWSIAYEFRCYLIVILMGALGLFRFPRVLLALCLMFLFSYSAGIVPSPQFKGIGLTGELPLTIRTIGVFLAGSVYYLFRDRVLIDGRIAALAAIVLFAALFFQVFAEPAFAVLGGYIILWVAQWSPLKPITSAIKDDISYGVYLYAWPITNTLIYFNVTDNPWLLGSMTMFGAAVFGFLSWRIIEEPALRLKPKPPLPSKGAPAQ